MANKKLQQRPNITPPNFGRDKMPRLTVVLKMLESEPDLFVAPDKPKTAKPTVKSDKKKKAKKEKVQVSSKGKTFKAILI